MCSRRPGGGSQAGATLAELVVVIALMGLIFGITISSITATAGGLKAGTDQLVSTTKLARSLATSTTTPHRIVPVDETSVALEFGGPCGDAGATWTRVADSEVELPGGIVLGGTSWDVCFNTRGWTTDVHTLRVYQDDSYQELSVLLGGSVRIGSIERMP